MLKDAFGVYETTFTYVEPDNGKTYEFRKYVNSKRIKEMGGMYSLYCQEDNCIIFRRSEYLRDKSYKKFSGGCCEDSISYSNLDDEELIPIAVYENDNCMHISKVKRYYSLPGKIDLTKLTEEEFQTLRKLIKKRLVID